MGLGGQTSEYARPHLSGKGQQSSQPQGLGATGEDPVGEGHGVRGGWLLVPPTPQSPDLHHLSPGSVDTTSLALGSSLQPSLLLSDLSESHPAGRVGSQGPQGSGTNPFRPPVQTPSHLLRTRESSSQPPLSDPEVWAPSSSSLRPQVQAPIPPPTPAWTSETGA